MSSWYAVTRRYTIEDQVFVQAESKSEAIEKARSIDYEDVDDGSQRTVSDTTHRRADLLDEKPQQIVRQEYGT